MVEIPIDGYLARSLSSSRRDPKMVKRLSTSLLAVALGSTACSARTLDASSDMAGGATGGGIKPLTSSTLFVRQVNALVPSGGCVADSSPTSLVLTAGTLDVAFSLQYKADLLVGFQPVCDIPNAPAGIAFQQATVRVEDAGGTALWGPVSIPTSGFVDSSPDKVSYGVTETILLGSELGARLADELQTTRGLVLHLRSVVRVSGRAVGGSTLESDEWGFPISICYGCLPTFPRDADDIKLAKQPNCALGSETPSTLVKPCRVGQEDPIDCRVCKEYFPNSSLCEP